ncbi:DsbE family thiol:disulfide interchange protein [Sphingomonas quercus]|uniref:DsbE family thiol:disulfide interchange protein n=1 Tax=Sphingomonas quercus TaxID=2842451 RepID=A0ABS6BMP3_9SPHN|nr:DsbE family thiol:disulfide interchange protein [Sphingomonas quercus]MBU3078907.1 DsbE family thiol:disulfide interchange protein [Sphingomonas quercus]
MNRKRLIWVPLIIFAVLALVSIIGLTRPNDPTIRSHLIGEALPDFALPASQAGKPGLATADFRQGRPRLLNVFASWCVPCAAEAPQLRQLAEAGVPIDAIAIRDRPADTARFLARYGDPYARIADDKDSSVQLALGSSGVPETFVIDGKGVIRHQHIGDIRPEDVPGILSALQAAQ